MDFKGTKLLNSVDMSILEYVINHINGKTEPDVSDQTVLIFQDGSVHAPEPTIPENLLGDKVFGHVGSS